MVTGTVNINGKDYTFNESGELTTGTTEKSGWVQSGKKWYYYDNNQKVNRISNNRRKEILPRC